MALLLPIRTYLQDLSLNFQLPMRALNINCHLCSPKGLQQDLDIFPPFHFGTHQPTQGSQTMLPSKAHDTMESTAVELQMDEDWANDYQVPQQNTDK